MAKRLQIDSLPSSLLACSLNSLSLEGGSNYLVLERLPPSLGALVREELRKRWKEQFIHFVFEELEAQMKVLQASSEAYCVVLDASHVRSTDRVVGLMKQFLSRAPKHRLVVLGQGLDGVRLSNWYGKGEVVDASRYAEGSDEVLLQFCHRLQPRYQLEQLVVGRTASEKLDDAIEYIRSREFCEKQWGFGELHSRGHGVALLFHGPSGTGKTMAAECVASALGMPLYPVQLSRLLSKWIGETEKNLSQVFEAARAVRGVLFFDEGEALFSKRGSGEGAQEKYSNMEVNHLLQEIENFDGIVIVNSNLEGNIDRAFLRRFKTTIRFSEPDAALRKKIWQSNTPKKLPLDPGVDWDHLAQLTLTGGMIRNAVREAAAIAAADKRNSVRHEDFLLGVRRELQKENRDLSREQLGEQYWRSVGREWESLASRRSLG